jgi:hypothetical protein
VTMKLLMQFLNGATLASSWIFFEHVDKLDYEHLHTFNKEIQIVQQQFIIAELSQDGEEASDGHPPVCQVHGLVEAVPVGHHLVSDQEPEPPG